MRKVAVVSLSGGMDSSCLLIRLLASDYDIYALSFDYGQKHKIELERLQRNLEFLMPNFSQIKSHKIIEIPAIAELFSSSLISKNQSIPEGHYEEENMKSTVVPNRNAIFSSICYGYALSLQKELKKGVEVFLGVHSGDHAIYPDCTPSFFLKLQAAFMEGNWDSSHVMFKSPYMYSNKTEILKDCLKNCEKLNIDFDFILKNTITSYNPDQDGRSSGKSGSDIERIEAFINIGRKDPIEYVKPWEEIKNDALKILKKE